MKHCTFFFLLCLLAPLFFLNVAYPDDANLIFWQNNPATKAKSSYWQGINQQGFGASILASRANLSIGDTLHLTLTLTFPPSYEPQTENLIFQLLSSEGFTPPAFTLLSKQTSDPKDKSGEGQWQLEVLLSPQAQGRFPLTFHQFSFFPKKDPSQTKASQNPVALISGIIEIQVSLPQEAFNPIDLIAKPLPLSLDLQTSLSTANERTFITSKNIAAKAASDSFRVLQGQTIPWKVFPAILTLILLAAILLLPTPPPKRAPVEEIYSLERYHQQLERLESLAKDTQDHQALLYELDKEVRSFIQHTYQIQALTLTTEELLTQISRHSFPHDDIRSSLIAFLTQAEQLKFRRTPSSPEEYDKLLHQAYHFGTKR